MFFAALNGKEEVCKLLIENKVDVCLTKREDGKQPIHTSAEKGSVEVCKLLLAQKADVNSKRKDGETPLHAAASKSVYAYDSISTIIKSRF